jgi:hypothetical protein
VNENPDIALPSNLDVEVMVDVEYVQDSNLPIEVPTPAEPFKDSGPSTPWTEVVRKGKNRNKTRSRNDKISSNDRRCLEY